MGKIHIGVGGWVYEPWRKSFYPPGLSQKRELEYASTHLTAIEINGTYYGSQKPESFARWHDETPADFVFTLKGPRFATNRRVLAEAGGSIEKFLTSGVTRLKQKLGPLNWQFMASKKFDAADFEAFLTLLPKSQEGLALRHAVEVRHESFACAEFVTLCRNHGVAIITGADSEFPVIADVTADFVYARLMGTVEKEKLGYSKAALTKWASRAEAWASGGAPKDLKLVTKAAPAKKRDVFLFVISGAKEKNPAAAMALIEQVQKMIALYGIKNCDTMKKARAWLDRHKIAYRFHDYKTEGIDKARLEGWAAKVGWEVLLNRAGTTFRKLPEAEKTGLTEKRAIALMLAQPSMIKRPVLENGAVLTVGFKPEAYSALKL